MVMPLTKRGFMEQFFSITFAIVFLTSLFWAASWHSQKTGLRFRYSLSFVWWLAIAIMACFVSLFTAFFQVFK
jgi:hypothetical protein